MSPTTMVIAASILLPAVGLLAWAWFAVARVTEEFSSFSDFEGKHFEIGPQASENAGGARWATPG